MQRLNFFSWRQGKVLLAYASAVLLVAVATLVRFALDPLIGKEAFPFMTYFLASALAARFLRTGPCLVTILLGALATDWFFLPPHYSLETAASNVLTVGVFITTNLIVLSLARAMRRGKEQLEIRVQERTAELKQANVALNKANETLEQRVGERTKELQTVSRTLKALGHSNAAVMRASSEQELLDAVCRRVVQDCGQTMVWIGFREDDENKSVRPVAYAGFEEGYLETLKITWADTGRGRGPTGMGCRWWCLPHPLGLRTRCELHSWVPVTMWRNPPRAPNSARWFSASVRNGWGQEKRNKKVFSPAQ